MSIVSQILANPDRYSVQELQQGMQSGMIPGYVAIPLIQDKVKKQQRMQMAMQGQGAPGEDAPTVAEDVLQQADQSQGLPMLESNLPAEEQSYAPGGIVAFEHGGPVKHFKVGGLDIDPEDYASFGARELLGQDYVDTSKGIAALEPYANLDDDTNPSGGLADEVRRNMAVMRQFYGEAPSSKEDIGKLRTLLEQRSAQAAEDAKTAKERNIIGLLANIAANPSQYSSVAIGSGTAKSLPEFAAAEAAQRKQQMDDAMAGLSLTKAEREEALAGLPGALQLTGYGADTEAKKAAARAKVAIARINANKERYGGFDIQAMTARANAMAFEQFDKPLDQLGPKEKAKVLGAAATAQQRDKQAAQFDANAIRNALGLGNLGLQQSNINHEAYSASLASFDRNKATDRRIQRNYDAIEKQFGTDVALDWKNNQVAAIYNANPGIPQRLPMKQLPEGVAALVQKKGGEAPAPATAPKAAGSSTLSAVDQKALEWANANPKDPRADQIKARLGSR
jgi:hypothetical protein